MRRRRTAFVLLDVIVSIAILSIVVVTALRAFHQSFGAVRRSEIMSRAGMLADAKLEEFELLPPSENIEALEGNFAEEGFYSEDYFPNIDRYRWEAEFEEIEIEYPDIHLARRFEDQMTQLRLVHLRIFYREAQGSYHEWVPAEIFTYLMPYERFSVEAIRENHLYEED